jgi:hypothetical protein
VRGTAHAGHALRAEGHVEQRGRSRPVRRHEPLGERHDAGALRHAEPAELGDGLADALRGHGEEDQVSAREGLSIGTEVLHPEVARELHTWEIALVLAVVGELAGLLRRAGQQRGPNPRPLEQDCDRRAERPGPDDRGTTRMLAGVADGRGR